MKKLLFFLFLPLFLIGCGNKSSYVLNEKTFFLVMTNIQYYPEEYINKQLTFDCFTYSLTDTKGDEYLCVVRKCASGFGCKCGKDTIIGFLADKDLGLPEPKNQYEDTNDKAWIHVVGNLKNTNKTEIEIYGTNNVVEKAQFLSFDIQDFSLIDDYSNLHYYVGK